MLAIENADQLKMKLSYATAKFNKASVTRLLGDYAALLREISVKPAAALAELTRPS